ncbi:hypothetical protein BCR35DRAFT_295125 [Leucosporidium creatinivorum]|uniref:Citrate transporter-like domain-containing protein n=1 Tax=Leucosporidium creatinivorum TaxID=106004 RepID=A0A1Y2DZL4_9BASI|nr:hypothetical protein BCR35DRAFT_295125 [Leucosporidium creatinivorum]
MVAGLNARSWVGLVVYFTVMGLVIRGIRIPLPFAISRPLLRLASLLRLIDPPAAPTPRPSAPSPPPPSTPPVVPGESPSDSRPSLRSRSESKIGLTPSAGAEGVEQPLESPREKRLSIPLDLRTAPVAGVVLLLITTTIDGSVLRHGIVGEEGVRPYDVLVLFISLAYISTALDSTGGLRALAFYISQKTARRPKSSPPSADKTASGITLFSTLYGFWFVAGVLVGNDPIVLSGTAFLGYFTRVTGITVPTAWIFSQFMAANVASAALVSSNPTNVLLAGAFELNFLTGYTAYTLLPSVITALVAFPLLLFTFTTLKPPSRDSNDRTHPSQAYIPSQLLPPDVNPRSALLDPSGAIFHSALMGVTLAVLVGTSFVSGGKVEVYMVTAPAMAVALVRDVWSERKLPGLGKGEAPREESGIELDEMGAVRERRQEENTPERITLPSILRRLSKRFPTTSNTISRLPLSLLPFAGGIFVLSRSLTSLGWTAIFAGWLAKICINPAATVFFLGYFIALVLCPLCGTNIGATILLVEILRDSAFQTAPHVLADPRILKGAIFSTALASNLGAFSWTFSSSLAGLLWVSILRQKGIFVKEREFAGWNLLFLPVLSTVASGIVLMECYYF